MTLLAMPLWLSLPLAIIAWCLALICLASAAVFLWTLLRATRKPGRPPPPKAHAGGHPVEPDRPPVEAPYVPVDDPEARKAWRSRNATFVPFQ